MGRFVRVKGHAFAAWGVGKIIEVGDTVATVSWFDSPLTDPRVERIALEHLAPVTLERQTRVYWLDRSVMSGDYRRVRRADVACIQAGTPITDCLRTMRDESAQAMGLDLDLSTLMLYWGSGGDMAVMKTLLSWARWPPPSWQMASTTSSWTPSILTVKDGPTFGQW